MRFISKEDVIISGDVVFCYIDGKSHLMKAQNGKPNFGYHQGMIMRKKMIEEFDGFDMSYKILSDYDLLVRMVNQGVPLQIIDTKPIAYFSQGGTTSNMRTFIVTIKEKYAIYKLITK